MGSSCTSNKKKKKVVKVGKENFKDTMPVPRKCERWKAEEWGSANQKSPIENEETKLSAMDLHLEVPARTVQTKFPVWLEKDVEYSFKVRGEWTVLPEHGYVGCAGHASFKQKHMGAFIGALMGRVLGNPFFQVMDGLVYRCEAAGPLYLFANNSRFSINPTGKLDVYIDKARRMPIEEIEARSGWELAELDTTNGHDYLTPDEKEQYVLLNKVRFNPKLFANQYLRHVIDNTQSGQEICLKLQHYPSSKLFRPSLALYLAAQEHAVDMGNSGTTGHVSSDGTEIKTRIQKYTSSPAYFGENCCYTSNDPLEIVIKLLQDEGVQTRADRANILNEGFNQVGIAVRPHTSYKYNCVQVFGSNVKEKPGLSGPMFDRNGLNN